MVADAKSQAKLNSAAKKAEKVSAKNKEDSDKVKDARKNQEPKPNEPASKSYLATAKIHMELLNDLSKTFSDMITEEEEEVEKLNESPAPPGPSPSPPSVATTMSCREEIRELLHEIEDEIIMTYYEGKNNIIKLLDTLRSKEIIYSNIQKVVIRIKETNDNNEKKIITESRLTHFYNDNIKGQLLINNILKLIFIVVFAVFIFLFKNDMKMILKSLGKLSYDIFRWNLPSVSQIIMEMPLIISLSIGIFYIMWLFNNENIREISYYMIGTFIIYLMMIEYLINKLNNTKLKSVLYLIAVIPYILYYIIEKINMDHNIIPIYDKDTKTKIAYKDNKSLETLIKNDDINKMIEDLQYEYS